MTYPYKTKINVDLNNHPNEMLFLIYEGTLYAIPQ